MVKQEASPPPKPATVAIVILGVVFLFALAIVIPSSDRADERLCGSKEVRDALEQETKAKSSQMFSGYKQIAPLIVPDAKITVTDGKVRCPVTITYTYKIDAYRSIRDTFQHVVEASKDHEGTVKAEIIE